MSRRRRNNPRLTDERIKELNPDFFDPTFKSYVQVTPKTENQRLLVKHLQDFKKDIVIVVGPAGSGKSLLCTYHGLQGFKNRDYNKIVITRPAVSVDEEHGFLPGDLISKMKPWMRPLLDIMSNEYSTQELQYLIENERIEIAPLAFTRGRTFHHSWIIADEMQNATPSQMKMILTRIGSGSKLVITGDLNQHDRNYEQNGLWDFTNRLVNNCSSRIAMVTLNNDDIVRHPVISEILNLYGEKT